MGKRKKGYPSIEDVLDRPWCYYCERDFDDLKILISHQKAKHFKCDRCGRRLNTAGGLSVHLNQVHKEQLNSVENALPNRQGLEVEIFGMEGIPDDVMQTHNTRVMQQYYEAAAERRAKSGNLMPGETPKRKKIKVETAEELRKRFQQWRDSGGILPQTEGTPTQESAPDVSHPAPTQTLAPSMTSQQPAIPNSVSGQLPFPAGLTFAPGHPLPGAPPLFPAQINPPLIGAMGEAASSLPSRPDISGVPGQFSNASYTSNGAHNLTTANDVDDLIASVTGQSAQAAQTEPMAHDKKPKKEKDKNTRLVYSDNDISPEEKMAAIPRYAFTTA